MKKFVVSILFASTLLHPVFAQNADTAAAIAARQESEERYKRMSADVESILSANAALQKKVSDLENQVQKLREDLDRVSSSNHDSATADSVKLLADKIQEVDKKREADKDLILEQFTKLGKKLEVVPTPRSAPRQPVSTESSNGPDKGYPYTIQPNDTLSGIVVDFNAQFKAKGMKTITMKQVMEANPNVSWNRLKIGQKIFVPAPLEK